MNKLRTRFSLALGLVLLVATVLPMLILYLLGASGLVEATYVTESQDLSQESWTLRLPGATPPVSPDLTPMPGIAERLGEEEWLAVPRTDPVTGERIPVFLFDPVIGRLIAQIPSNLQQVVFTSPVFKFRIDLPAWLAIGSLPLIGLLIGICLSIVLSRSVTRPVSQLAEAVQAVGRRELGYRVETKGSQELQDLAQSFNRMAEELEHAELARRNLMADIAHELRTPLSVLDGNLRAMLDGVHEVKEEEIALLYEQTHHLRRLVDDLRELSLAEADQLSLSCHEVDLAHLVKETVAYFDLPAQEQGIRLAIELDEPLVHPSLDDHRIRQVLHNLLSNAFRHTPKGGLVTVSAKWVADKKAVDISISDTGAGILPEDLPHIFDRFNRLKGTLEHDQDGTGLGLAIVKAIVEAQGGSVSAHSGGRDQGSTFTIRFPV